TAARISSRIGASWAFKSSRGTTTANLAGGTREPLKERMASRGSDRRDRRADAVRQLDGWPRVSDAESTPGQRLSVDPCVEVREALRELHLFPVDGDGPERHLPPR